MSLAAEDRNRRLLRARDMIDRRYAEPLDVAALARVAHVSAATSPAGSAPCSARRRTATSSGGGSSGRWRSCARPTVRHRDLPRGRLPQPRHLQPHFARVVGESPTAYRERTAATRRAVGQHVPPASRRRFGGRSGRPAEEQLRRSGASREALASQSCSDTSPTPRFIVLDQDEALEFYVGKLGMVVATDADLGRHALPHRHPARRRPPPADLAPPRSAVTRRATAEQVRELIAKGGAGGGVIFETDDCVGTYEALRARGGRIHPGADRALLRHRLCAARPVRQPAALHRASRHMSHSRGPRGSFTSSVTRKPKRA